MELGTLGFPELTGQRKQVISDLRILSRSVAGSITALGLGPTQRREVDRNRALTTSPVLPAIDRYTGILYESVDAASLSPAARRFTGEHVVIHSALFGLVRASDQIPAYRLSHDSRLPRLGLRAHWHPAVSSSLTGYPGLVIDMRSSPYVALGAAPSRSFSLKVMSDDGEGRRRAVSHFNKGAKGAFVRAIALAGIRHDTVDSLVDWASASGIRLQPVGPRELHLVM